MLGVRIDESLARELDLLAREQRRSKSEIVRDAVRHYIERHTITREAQRQSLLIAASQAEAEDVAFVASIADTVGWE